MASERRLEPRSIHSMEIEPAPAPMSQRRWPARGRRGGEGHGANIGLGELAIILEPGIVEARAQADDACIGIGHDLYRQGVERIDAGEGEGVGLRFEAALTRAAHGLENDEARGAETALREQGGDGLRRRLVPGQGEEAGRRAGDEVRSAPMPARAG